MHDNIIHGEGTATAAPRPRALCDNTREYTRTRSVTDPERLNRICLFPPVGEGLPPRPSAIMRRARRATDEDKG